MKNLINHSNYICCSQNQSVCSNFEGGFSPDTLKWLTSFCTNTDAYQSLLFPTIRGMVSSDARDGLLINGARIIELGFFLCPF